MRNSTSWLLDLNIIRCCLCTFKPICFINNFKLKVTIKACSDLLYSWHEQQLSLWDIFLWTLA
uniref:Uncharacterized protein n=1 Tax=Ciona intestinalis TaxID=7719 RepID=H2Y3J6_CIOIN